MLTFPEEFAESRIQVAGQMMQSTFQSPAFSTDRCGSNRLIPDRFRRARAAVPHVTPRVCPSLNPDYSRRVREVGFVQVVRCASGIARRAECSVRTYPFADVTHQRVLTCSTHPTLDLNNPGLTFSRGPRLETAKKSEGTEPEIDAKQASDRKSSADNGLHH